MNSFRGGPVRATVNALTSDGKAINGSGNYNMDSNKIMSHHHTVGSHQRPSSSKPHMKGSFTSESENHLAKELAAHEQQ